MKTLYILGLNSLAAIAFGTAFTSSAGAAEWLVNGAQVTSSLAASANEELSIEETVGFLGTPMRFQCSATFEEKIGPEGSGEATKSLTLTGVEGIGCVKGSGSACEEAANSVTVIALPIIQLITVEGKILELLSREGGFGYLLNCLVLGSMVVKAECLATDTEIEVKNVTGGVQEVGGLTPRLLCNKGSEGGEPTESGVVTSLGSLITTTEGSLSVS